MEIEFALTLPDTGGAAPRFALLQVRRMGVATEAVDLGSATPGWRPVVASDHVMGNGVIEGISDVVYVVPERFDLAHAREIAAEVAAENRRLLEEGRPYLLIGFGRWGSADPWLGVPVNWGDVSGARMLVEAASRGRQIEMSQGSHFFHNLAAFAVPYASVPLEGTIDWAWLAACPAAGEGRFLRHVRLAAPLRAVVDGRVGKGAVLRRAGAADT